MDEKLPQPHAMAAPQPMAAPRGDPEGRSWRARAATEDDLPALVSLFNAVFRKSAPLAQLRWKYLTNPHGPAATWVAADREKGIVGAYSYVARRLWLPAEKGSRRSLSGDTGGKRDEDQRGAKQAAGKNTERRGGREVGARQAADAMVLAGFRKQGIFVCLDQAVTRDDAVRGEPVAFAFEGRQSVRGFRRAGWQPIGTVVRHRCFVSPSRRAAAWRAAGPLLAALLRPLDGRFRRRYLARCRARLEGFDVKRIAPGAMRGKEFDALWRRARETLGRIAVARDAAYLRWRYLEAPAGRHTLLALRRDGALRGWAVVEAARRGTGASHGPRTAPRRSPHAVTPGVEGFLVDALAEDPALAGAVLAAGLGELIRRGATKVTLGALEGHPYLPAVAELGFRRPLRPRPYTDEQPFIIKLLPAASLPAADQPPPPGARKPGAATPEIRRFLDPRQWFVLEGDRDDEYASRGEPV